MQRKTLLAVGLLLIAPRLALAAYRDSNEAVSPQTQMNGGGCYPVSRTGPPTEMLNLLNPEWAAIDVGSHLPPESDPVALHGTVVFAKINEGGDDPGNHDSDDQNTLIDVDAADMGLVATGNIGPHGEEAGSLEWELEIGKYPLFAWAGPGDRCVVTHQPNSIQQATIECFPLSQPLANVNTSNVAFYIPLPPRPANGTRPPRVKVYDHTPLGLPQPAVTTTFVDGPTPLVHAVVHMTAPVGGVLPSMVGKTIIAGWRGDRTQLAKVRLQVTAIEIVNALKPVNPAVSERMRCSETSTQDCSATPCPPGETCRTFGGTIPGWEVFLEANGNWQKLAGLEGIVAPATVPQSLVYDEAIPLTGSVLRLHATGHSLDCRESVYGMSIRRDIEIFGPTDTLACLENAESHDVGDLDLTFTAAALPPRGRSASYVTQSVGGEGGSCSTSTGQRCLTDADCPSGQTGMVNGGPYRLHYTIRRR